MSRFEQDWNALDVLDLPANQQGRLVRKIKQGDVSSVFPMIIKTADESWGRLPPHTRAWYTREEAIAAGVAFTVTSVAKTFDKKKGTKFSTYLQDCLTNFFITIESEPLRAQKRWEGDTISFERDLVKVDNRYLTTVEFYLTHTMKIASPEEDVISRIDAERHFLQVYKAATPTLRKYLIRWFLTTRVIRMKDGEEYRAARRELRRLAPLHNFTFDMAHYLAGNDLARAETTLEVLRHYRTESNKKITGYIEYEELTVQ